MMGVMDGAVIGVPIEDLAWSDGMVRVRYMSIGARVSANLPGQQMKVYDPYKAAILERENGDFVFVAWGGGGRNHNNHNVIVSEKIVKVSAWRPMMSQVITESGLTISWSKSTQCGSCGGIPAPKGVPWTANQQAVAGAFKPQDYGL